METFNNLYGVYYEIIALTTTMNNMSFKCTALFFRKFAEYYTTCNPKDIMEFPRIWNAFCTDWQRQLETRKVLLTNEAKPVLHEKIE